MLTLICAFIGLSFISGSEEEKETIYSVYFNAKAAPGTKKLTGTNSTCFGRYELVPQSENDMRAAAGDQLVVDESGIYISKNKLLSISREEVRENSKYLIREGYLHGVLENDSVLVALEDERYYFLLPTETYLYVSGSDETQLYQGISANEYLILSAEDEGYLSAVYFSCSAGKIALKELDFDQKEFDFRSVTNRKISGEHHPLYLLNPSAKEWKQIMQYFTTYDNYRKL